MSSLSWLLYFRWPHVLCAVRKRDAAKLSSLGCQRNDGEAKQAFVSKGGCGGGDCVYVCEVGVGGSGIGLFLVALH